MTNMENLENQPLSKTYMCLYNGIIGELLSEITRRNERYAISDRTVKFKIGRKIDEYEKTAKEKMSSERLDRHKLASCICGSIIEIKPLVRSKKDIPIKKRANEELALCVGSEVIKFFMIKDLLNKANLSEKEEYVARMYLKDHYEMQFPTHNVRDRIEYKESLLNSLLWSHFECNTYKKECFPFDIWAYSIIFYHLEVYNQEALKHAFEEYKKETGKSEKDI